MVNTYLSLSSSSALAVVLFKNEFGISIVALSALWSVCAGVAGAQKDGSKERRGRVLGMGVELVAKAVAVAGSVPKSIC